MVKCTEECKDEMVGIPKRYTIRSLDKITAPVREVGDQFKIGPDTLVTFAVHIPRLPPSQPN
jgi:hypothetical protein